MNTFIQPYIAGVQIEVRCPLYDPREIRADRERFLRDDVPELAYANSFHTMSGPHPGRGWILIAREDYNKLTNTYFPLFQLEIGDPTNPNNVRTLTRLCIVQARCVTRGLTTDPKAIYLLEIADRRIMLCNNWYRSGSGNDTGTFSAQTYNIRNPDYLNDFDPNTKRAGIEWTWTQMLTQMWEAFDTTLGNTFASATGGALPYNPIDTPEGYWLPGYNMWFAFNDILEELGMVVTHDPTKGSVSGDAHYSIIEQGVDDSDLDALYTKYIPNLEDDYEWLDTGAGRIPDKIIFHFRGRYSLLDFYEVQINAPAEFPTTHGNHFIMPHFTVIIGDSTSETEATNIATERAEKYYQMFSTPSTTKIYTGALPFATGPLVTSVRWYQDYYKDGRYGWKTEVIYAPRLIQNCDCGNDRQPRYAEIPTWDLGPAVAVPDGDYGDVTVSSNGTVWTVNSSGSTEGTLAATGNSQGTAASITVDRVKVTGADGTKGVILPDTQGAHIFVWNSDATNNLNVYPPSGAKLNGSAANDPVTVGAQEVRAFARLDSTHWTWVSYQTTDV